MENNKKIKTILGSLAEKNSHIAEHKEKIIRYLEDNKSSSIQNLLRGIEDANLSYSYLLVRIYFYIRSGKQYKAIQYSKRFFRKFGFVGPWREILTLVENEKAQILEPSNSAEIPSKSINIELFSNLKPKFGLTTPTVLKSIESSHGLYNNVSLIKVSGVHSITNCRGERMAEYSFGTSSLTKYHKSLKVVEIDKPSIILTSYYGINNFCHILLDQLPRLYFPSELYGINSLPTIYVDKESTGLLEKLIKHIKIPLKIDYLENGVEYKFNEAYLTAPLNHPMNNGDENLVKFIKLAFAETKFDQSNAINRLFINRPSGRRGIENKSETLEILNAFKFRKVELESLSISEQATLFSNTEIIVSPHGAGLSNLIFCKKGTTVIEIFGERYGTPAFAILAAALGLNYIAMFDNADRFSTSNAKYKMDDIIVPEALLLKLLTDKTSG
ncbi:hypothetical protein AVL56_17275 [Alteromonas stellipolaris]|uniref:glycosyltransferase family 61 protein n=1 Tax=Alteromonas stellipolaris TaxID=233316 RepID=UPI000770425D|nr:glycosyltransferase family 61 protein [Alteromonas stellipolaris]AMJ95886.1 hypothetical protein AVL56_17275 [Alteromonas stellipolaris]